MLCFPAAISANEKFSEKTREQETPENPTSSHSTKRPFGNSDPLICLTSARRSPNARIAKHFNNCQEPQWPPTRPWHSWQRCSPLPQHTHNHNNSSGYWNRRNLTPNMRNPTPVSQPMATKHGVQSRQERNEMGNNRHLTSHMRELTHIHTSTPDSLMCIGRTQGKITTTSNDPCPCVTTRRQKHQAATTAVPWQQTCNRQTARKQGH